MAKKTGTMSAMSAALDEEISAQEVTTATVVLGGKDYNLCSRPLTPADFATVNHKIETSFQSDPTNFDGQVEMLLVKARGYDPETGDIGPLMFNRAVDRERLRRVGVTKVSKLFADLFKDALDMDEDEAVDTAKGN